MIDFLNSPAIGSLNWGYVLIIIPVTIAVILISLGVIGAFIGFLLTEKHRRETWDKPLSSRNDGKER